MPEGDTIFRASRMLNDALAGGRVARFVLRTHMRIHGVSHLYPRGVRWRRPHSDMRIVIGTAEFEAVAFNVPVAELTTGDDLKRDPSVSNLGPDILTDEFDAAEAAQRIELTPDADIADALLNQQAVAGVGNIFKCEALFAAELDPFTRVADLSRKDITRVVEKATCGAVIARRKAGDETRITYWCPHCHERRVAANARTV